MDQILARPYLHFKASENGTHVSGIMIDTRKDAIKEILNAKWSPENRRYISSMSVHEIGLLLFPKLAERPDVTAAVKEIRAFGESPGHYATIHVKCRPRLDDDFYTADGFMFISGYNIDRTNEIKTLLSGYSAQFQFNENYD